MRTSLDFSRRRILLLVTASVFELYMGIVYVWSVFHEAAVSLYDWDHLASSLIFSIMLPMNVSGIIIGGFICDKKGPRFVIRLGSLLIVGGLALSALVPVRYPRLLYLTYATMVGFGCGMDYNAATSCVHKWWIDRKGFAGGIFCCSVGLSTVVFAPLISYLIDKLGMRMMFLALCGVFLVLLCAAYPFLTNPPEDYIRTLQASSGKPNDARQYRPVELFRSLRYYRLLVFNLCIMPGYLMMNTIIKSFGILKGLSETGALLCVMLSGVFSASGRLFLTWLSDRVFAERILFGLFAASVVCELLLRVSAGVVYIALICAISFIFGGSAGLLPVLAAEAFGTRYLSSNISVMMVSVLVGGVVYPIVGSLVTKNGVPGPLMFFIPVVLSMLGMLLMLLTNKKKRNITM